MARELKIKSAEELKEIAKTTFEAYKKAEKLSVTNDGEAFITDKSDMHAKNHANNNVYGKKLEITEFTRAAVEGVTDTDKDAIALIAKINACKKAADVEEIKAVEASGENRPAVLAACDEKIVQLKA